MAYVRTVKTASGATAVQIVYSCHRGSRQIGHLGSAHTAAEVELLKAAARQKLAAGQGELDAALAVSRWIEAATGWSIRKFVKTTRRYRTIQIQAGDHVITAADPLPADLRDALNKISSARPGTH